MEFRARKPRRPAENVVPLINVVFLLLVFFMLTGTLRPPPPLEVELPREHSQADVAPPDPDVPALALSRDGTLAFEGTPISADALEAELRAHPAQALALRADARAPARHVLPLLEKLEALGVAEVDLVTDLAR